MQISWTHRQNLFKRQSVSSDKLSNNLAVVGESGSPMWWVSLAHQCSGKNLLMMRTTCDGRIQKYEMRENSDGGTDSESDSWSVADWEPTGEVCLHEVCLCRRERLVRQRVHVQVGISKDELCVHWLWCVGAVQMALHSLFFAFFYSRLQLIICRFGCHNLFCAILNKQKLCF